MGRIGLWLATTALLVSCSSSLVCGEGTVQMGGHCVATVACGPETVVVGDVCVPSSSLMCGAGTVRMGDVCVPDDLRCPPGTIQRGEVCLDADVVVVRIPFPAGRLVTVGQGMHGGFSHEGRSVHALDFEAAIGTPVVAARDGIVVGMRESSATGCAEPRCADQGNFVRIDHGDGTFGSYYHLDTNGASVEVGDRVCAGEPIGLSGNTGFSTGPHLHFQVEDPFGYSLPLYFEELGDTTEGFLFAGLEVTSSTAPPPTCDHVIVPSRCPADLFGHDGIVELAGMPCSLVEAGATYRISGRAVGGAFTGQLAMLGDLDADWSYRCGTTEADGRFAVDLVIGPARIRDVAYAAVTSAGRAECISFDGWDASVVLTVR